jgi:hypothetical protein
VVELLQSQLEHRKSYRLAIGRGIGYNFPPKNHFRRRLLVVAKDATALRHLSRRRFRQLQSQTRAAGDTVIS